jgi:drug/metabolite transporter (DMT)-like permease
MSRSAAYPLAAVTAWGLMFAVLGRALHRVDPVNLTAVRYGLAILILIAILVAREGPAALRPGRRAVEVAVIGTIGFAGFNVFTNLALQRTQPQNAALVVALAPLLTVLVRWARDGIRPRPVTLLLVGAALLGVLLVISKGRLSAFGAIGAGDLLMFGAVTGWAIYTHGAGRFPEFSALRYATLTALSGTVTILVLTGIADAAGWQHPPSLADVRAIGPELGYVVVVGAVVAILAWNTGVRRLGAANAALFLNLVPVVALTLATLQGYRPRPAELLGTAITAAAIVTANLFARRPESARRTERPRQRDGERVRVGEPPQREHARRRSPRPAAGAWPAGPTVLD